MIFNVWTEFAVCFLLIAYAGTKLSLYGDVIADKTGLSGNWIGLIMLATATSLPELITGVSSVTLAAAPNVAVGNVLGACVFNLMFLVVVDFLHRKESIYRRASQGHILSAGFGVIMIGLVGFNVLLGQRNGWAIGNVGVYAPVIVLMYLIAIRSIFLYEKQQVVEYAEDVTDRYAGLSLRHAVVGYGLAVVVVVIAGVWMPFIATELASTMGWHTSFVGTLLVPVVTSMPEFSVTLGALRIGALDMAIANLLGSNLFNIVIIAIDDLLYQPGPLLSGVSVIHGASAMSAMIMTGLTIVGILYRSETRVLRTVGWISLGLFTIYLLNSMVLYLYEE